MPSTDKAHIPKNSGIPNIGDGVTELYVSVLGLKYLNTMHMFTIPWFCSDNVFHYRNINDVVTCRNGSIDTQESVLFFYLLTTVELHSTENVLNQVKDTRRMEILQP